MYVLYNGNKKGKLNSVFFKNSWGYFYNEYHARCYYWEFVKIFQKELIIIILIFYTDDVIVKVFIIKYVRALLYLLSSTFTEGWPPHIDLMIYPF